MNYTGSRRIVPLIACLIIGLLLTGCRVDPNDDEEQIADLQREIDQLQEELDTLRRDLQRLESTPLVTEDGKVKLAVYFGLSADTDILTVPVLLPADMEDDPHLAALQLLIAGPDPDSILSPVAPPETDVLSLQVEDGLATVDFSSEIGQYAVGSAGESMVLGGIVNTLTEFTDVDRVMILVEGEEGVSLGGHYALNEPLERFDDLIP